ncbi:MAG: tetratricopeptide repeat protein, partial [Candidatus Eremiobacteraeota bacterium]|nr:tetratricopeptide repeat protein [Candidatus Eremiobacteraeota bacterium]
TAQPRQRTLTGLIDWSYELLTPQEQAVFCRLSVFAGGFGLDAAESVGADDSMDGMDVLDVLSSLTDKSLVVANTARRSERYHMLESLRAYAMEKLNLTPEVRERVQQQHAEYFQKTAELAGESFGTKPDASWLLDVEPEIDNFRVALNWAFGAGENALLGSIIAGSLEHLWSEGGLEAEGRKWISEAQSRLDETAHPRVAARLWRALAGLTSGKRSYEAAQRACALSEAAGEERGLAYAMYVLAASLQDAGKLDEAQALNERVYQWFNQYGDKRNVAACLRQQANVLQKQGDMAGARKLYERALAVFKALDAQSDSGIVFANLARLAFREGNALEALSDVDRAIEFASNARNATHLAAYHIDSAVYRIALGNFDVARKEALDGLHWAREAKNDVEVVAAIEHLALVTALKKQAQQAARLFGYADAKYKQLEEARTEANAWSVDKLMIALRDELGEPEIRAFSAEGAAWSDEQAVREALKV